MISFDIRTNISFIFDKYKFGLLSNALKTFLYEILFLFILLSLI